MRVSATTLESVIGGIGAPRPPGPPPPYPALMVEGLQGLTAALKLESRIEHNGAQECLDCLDCLSLPQSPGKMAAAKSKFCQDAG